MDVVNRFKDSFTSIFTKIFQLLAKTTPPVLPPQQAPAADQQNLDWAMIMIGFCLPSAIEIALQSLQVQSQLPPMFHFLSLAIIFSFSFLFLGKLTRTRFPIAAQEGFQRLGHDRRGVTAGELRGGEGADDEGKREPHEKGLEGLVAFEEEESEKKKK
ncbi:hypothetical protein WN943_014152 [Citrus x changshan-huyou]